MPGLLIDLLDARVVERQGDGVLWNTRIWCRRSTMELIAAASVAASARVRIMAYKLHIPED
jgi:hypothetical protein